VDPNVTKALPIVAFGQTTFGLTSLFLDNYVAEAGEFEDFLGLLVYHQGEKKEGKGYKSVSSCRRSAFRRHRLETDDFVAQLVEGHCNIFGQGVIWEMPDDSFYC
jgi:hypothetical protein